MSSAELRSIRRSIIETSFKAQAGHIPSALSIVEILYVMYGSVKKDDDIFVLSKGHGCLALYSVLAHFDLINKKDLENFCEYDSLLGGHPHRGKHKEFYCSAGSLGHGLPMSVGTALAKRISKSPGKVYCLIGDGESNEGTIWESFLLAKNLQLDNLVCIVDDNNSQTRSLPVYELENKIRNFGWNVVTVDGHDTRSLVSSLSSSEGLSCVICKTTKGKGITDMENNTFAWHHGPPNNEEYEQFMEELKDA